MEAKQANAKNNNKISYFVTLGIMGAAIFLVVTSAVKNDILRDKFAFSNTFVDVVCLIFLILLFGFSFSRTGDTKKTMQAFKVFLTLVFASIFFSALGNTVYGMPDKLAQIKTFATFSYIFSGTFYAAIWGYQKQFLKKTEKIGIVTVLLNTAALIGIMCVIVNIFLPINFIITEQGVFAEGFTDYPSFIMNCFCIIVIGIATFSSDMELKKKLSFASFLPVPAFIATMNLLHGILAWELVLPTVTSIGMILPLYIIFFNIHIELENEIIKHEKEQTRLQFAAMISQIQPHFVYNSLSVIAALCEDDPKLAAKAADTFSDYLRENIDFAGKSKPVSFSEELKHIKTYVWLEQLRFPNKLQMEYDIKCSDFGVPALSVQPLVENAIKHGICKTRYGGTVKLCTFEDDDYYVVTVSDDGTGFDISKPLNDGKQHVGIENAGFRIKEMFDGSLDIVSAPGSGTKVSIKIPKGQRKYEDNYSG